MYRVRTAVTDGIEKVVYPNGLTLTLRADHRVPVAAARCYVRGGSIAEEAPGGSGIAHLLEHLIATAAAAEMEEHGDGALLNAFTTHDYTCFHWSAAEEDLVPSLCRFFAGLRRIASLSFDLDAEKNVVMQEIDLFREKRLGLFQQCFLEEMFEAHPLRYPVCGYKTLLREVSAADLGHYIARLYTGANVRLVVSGAFDEESLVGGVEEACASLPEGRRFELHVEEPPRSIARVFDFDTPDVRGGYTQVGMRIGGDFEDSVAFAALARSVNSSRGPTFAAGEVEARSVASAFHAGYFHLLAHHAADGSAAIEEAMRQWLDDVAAGRAPLPLDAVRAAAHLDDEPTLDGWAALLGHGDVRSGHPLETLRFQERLRTIGEDDVRSAVARHLAGGNLTIGRLRQRSDSAVARPPRPAPAVYEETLPNGARLVILPTPSAQACCQVLWRGGVFAENGETNGLCSLMARLLPRSISEELRQALALYRETTRASFYAFCDENFFGVSLTASARELDAGLDLLAAMAIQPVFTRDAVDDERRETAERHASSRISWLPQTRRQLKSLLYRRHPYRLSEGGTAESLLHLTLDDVAGCHVRTCVGDNIAVVVSGAVTPEHVRDRLASLFAAVPRGSFCPTGQPEDGTAVPGMSVITRPWTFGALAIGYRGVEWDPETWLAFNLLKALLVGPENNSVRGRLTRAMRDEGAAYSTVCLNQSGFGEGYFALLAAFAPQKEERAVAIAEREIERLRSGDITAGELDHCRKLYLLQHLRLYESPRAHAYGAGREVLFSKNPASWSRISDQVREITANDVASAAQLAFLDRSRGVVLVRPQGG